MRKKAVIDGNAGLWLEMAQCLRVWRLLSQKTCIQFSAPTLSGSHCLCLQVQMTQHPFLASVGTCTYVTFIHTDTYTPKNVHL